MSKHPIVHIEFSAKDLEQASKFYSDPRDDVFLEGCARGE